MSFRKKKGKQTIIFHKPPVIKSWASIVGPKEGEGPWGKYFDKVLPDYLDGQTSWELTETKMLRDAVTMTLEKQAINKDDVDVFLAGDLLNQIISANYAARELAIPFLGLYGACSTMAESMILGAILIDGYFYDQVVAAACSHHYTAQRQFRFPSEQGVQFAPSSQWTATAAGAVLLYNDMSPGIKVTCATVGRVIDKAQKDPNNMGAAMAPAAVDTIKTHFTDLGRTPDYYDLIITGDLGEVGYELAKELFIKEGLPPMENFNDCGVLLFSKKQSDINAGASGCGCSAAMLCGPLLRKMFSEELKKILFVPTGALMSPISTFQGESIPAIAHAVAIELL